MPYLSYIFVMHALYEGVYAVNRLLILQKKTLGLIYYKERNIHITHYYYHYQLI